MCLIVFALDRHPRYRLVLAANRDEYFSRPTSPASPGTMPRRFSPVVTCWWAEPGSG